MSSALKFSLCLTILAVFAVPAAYCDITVTVTTSLAPNAFGSPSWSGYVSNAIYALENGLPSYGDPNSPTYYSDNSDLYANQPLVTSFNSWMGYADPGAEFGAAFADELGNRMHFGLLVTATDGATVALNDLSFTSSSSDPSDGLGFSWDASPWTYAPERVGIVLNPNGSIADIYDNGEDGGLPVNEIIYVGSGNAYWPLEGAADPSCTGCTTAQMQAAIDAEASADGGYTYTGTYNIDGASGSATFDVSAVPEPSAIVLLASVLGMVGISLRRRLAGTGK